MLYWININIWKSCNNIMPLKGSSLTQSGWSKFMDIQTNNLIFPASVWWKYKCCHVRTPDQIWSSSIKKPPKQWHDALVLAKISDVLHLWQINLHTKSRIFMIFYEFLRPWLHITLADRHHMPMKSRKPISFPCPIGTWCVVFVTSTGWHLPNVSPTRDVHLCSHWLE